MAVTPYLRWVEQHWTYSNIIFRTSKKKLECVHLSLIELKQPTFGFKRTDIEYRTKFSKFLIEQARTSFFRMIEHRTSNIVAPITTPCRCLSKRIKEMS